jgi:hypothetical protein
LARPGARGARAVAERGRWPGTQPRVDNPVDGRFVEVWSIPPSALTTHLDPKIEHLIDQIERAISHAAIVLIPELGCV